MMDHSNTGHPLGATTAGWDGKAKSKMINPAQYIAFVDKLNELEAASKKITGSGLPIQTGEVFEFLNYSISWDSMAARWTLIPETDDAPDLCSFNQTKDECSETDLCEQCHGVQVRLAADQDNANARRA